jgi:hypothetical protein
VFGWKKVTGRESQGAYYQDELIGDKPPVVKQLTLTFKEVEFRGASLPGYETGSGGTECTSVVT